ncbi:Alpha/Beta hydrolase protein [Syncephalis fuscata]|nr:Alpha/Beta hydrolase protein [Syncephalis fuscata]
MTRFYLSLIVYLTGLLLFNMTVTGYQTTIVNPDTDPLRMAYELHGSGDKRVILIMGMGATMETCELQKEALVKNGYQVCVFDNRGVGRTDAPETNYTTKQMANDTIGLLNHLGWTSGVHVVGASLGGLIAMELAINYPQYVKSLCLTSTLADATLPKNKEYSVEPIYDRIINNNVDRSKWAEQLFTLEWLEAQNDDEPSKTNLQWITEVMGKMAQTIPEIKKTGVFGQFNALKTHQVSDDRLLLIRKANIPIVICTGDVDKVVHMFNSEHMAKVLEAPLQIFKGCGHSVAMQEKNNYNKLLLNHFTTADNK